MCEFPVENGRLEAGNGEAKIWREEEGQRSHTVEDKTRHLSPKSHSDLMAALWDKDY